MTILEAYRNHAIFNGVAIAEDGTCVIFTESDATTIKCKLIKIRVQSLLMTLLWQKMEQALIIPFMNMVRQISIC